MKRAAGHSDFSEKPAAFWLIRSGENWTVGPSSPRRHRPALAIAHRARPAGTGELVLKLLGLDKQLSRLAKQLANLCRNVLRTAATRLLTGRKRLRAIHRRTRLAALHGRTLLPAGKRSAPQ
jgi:transposase